MAGKSGWPNESRRHGLASKGISTSNMSIPNAYGVKHDSHGNYLVSNGLLADLYEKAKSGVTKAKIGEKIKEVGVKAKEVGEIVKEKVVGTEAVREKRKEVTEQKEIEKLQKLEDKKVKSVERTIKKADERELKQAEIFGKQPKKGAVDVSQKGRAGAIAKKIASEERKVLPAQLTDLPEAVFTSKDADSMIAVAENKEKLVDFSNELKHDIRMLKVERNRLARSFNSDLIAERKRLESDRRVRRKQLKEEIDALKTTSVDDELTKHKIDNLIIDHRRAFQQKEIELNSLRNRDNVTLRFMDELGRDLGKVQHQINKRVRVLTASGKRRD